MERSNNILKNIWRTLAIIIAILMPIYGAWHHLFTLAICVGMYYAHKGEETKRTTR
jgi:hypothetical protein